MKRILVVDDDKASCELLREIFAEQNWQTTTAQTPRQARDLAADTPFDLIVSDINLESDETGLDLLRSWRESSPVILVTGFGSLERAVEAQREGAYDFISKPFKVAEVVETARRALQRPERGAVDPEARDQGETIEGFIVGRSPAMIELYKEIARVAPSRATVLITGESGTGKELVARSVHKHSPRESRAFVAVNCGALTDSLLEAELFGSVRGAYTGAHADRKGLWEEAEGGTLFLDEIGETSPAMQVKLLRALQEREIRPVGASRNRQVDARIVAASNRNLEHEVKEGRFREDLFYRLGVVTLHMPPLRERRSDIPLLAEKFLQRAAAEAGQHLHWNDNVLALLSAYDYPGNVRELQAAVEYAALRARDGEVTVDDLPPKLQSAEVRAAAKRSPLSELYSDLVPLEEIERRYLLFVLEATGGNRSRTAEVMRINRRTLYRMAERFGIKLEQE